MPWFPSVFEGHTIPYPKREFLTEDDQEDKSSANKVRKVLWQVCDTTPNHWSAAGDASAGLFPVSARHWGFTQFPRAVPRTELFHLSWLARLTER